MAGKTPLCFNECGPTKKYKTRKTITFRDVEISYTEEGFRCSDCGLEISLMDQASRNQICISEAYRKKVGLLTSAKIKEQRKKLELSQADLAKKMNVGIASVKRWEAGQIQTRSMDQSLRLALKGKDVGDDYTGNRELSLPRIKLVLKRFESELNRRLLKANDKMLFAAKYLWYADMLSHRELGRSMTGGTYAALKYGPQLNNYRDLINEIKTSKEEDAEPLSEAEDRIIRRVARKFPLDTEVYDVAHEEPVWKNRQIGQIIPYSDSEKIIGI